MMPGITTTNGVSNNTYYLQWPDRPVFSGEQVTRICEVATEAGMWHHSLTLLLYGVTEGIWVPTQAMKTRWIACFGKFRLGLPQEQRIAMASLMLVMCEMELRGLTGITDDA